MCKLSHPFQQLLGQVASKYDIEGYIVSAIIERRRLADADRDILINALTSEFSETGLLGDDEPNLRGLQLEGLIDLVLANTRVGEP